ncbi:MAG TPA: Gfo/Idh/MocA family oxidoreductase [Pirellulaceae bacterium]|jgi:predicted dehydrogenase|nr:Gfo/Idh/MocA family oxidoreductase [Pirellulaceae bacterium]
MTKRLSAVVVGTGFIGPVHIEGLRRAGVRVAGMVGSTPEKSREAAERFDLPRGYASLEEVLADDAVDSVHLTTPNRFHFEQAAAALRAGKHVLCEKPLAMNSRETSELVRIASESGHAAGVCYNVRYYPLCLEAADRVRRGEVGELFHVAGSYAQDWLFHPTDFNWRVVAEEGGELRAVADIGTHWLDLIQFVTNRKIASLCADLQTVHPERRRPKGGVETFSGKLSKSVETEAIEVTTEDYGCLMLLFEGGGRGVVWVSQAVAGRKNALRFELAGSKRSLAWESERPNELWIGSRDSANETLIRDPALLGDSARRHADYPGGHNEGFPDTFKQLFRSFYDYVAAGDYAAPCSFPTFADGHREVLLCEAVLKSHRERRWVDV